jgi:hypothetical protein
VQQHDRRPIPNLDQVDARHHRSPLVHGSEA